MQGRDNIAKDGSSTSTLKAIDGELIRITSGAVSLLPSTTSSHAVTDDNYDILLSSHCFQSNNAQSITNLASEQSMADAAPVPPKIKGTQERATVSRNISPQPPTNIRHSVAVKGNTCAASNGTLVIKSDQRPKDTIPCNLSDSGALIAGPKETLAKTREANDRVETNGITKDLLQGANAQHSSTFSTCPHPAAAMDNLKACKVQENGQQPCEVSHNSSNHSSTVSTTSFPLHHYLLAQIVIY